MGTSAGAKKAWDTRGRASDDKTTAEKHAALKAAGWRFERFDRTKKQWVPRRSLSRTMTRAVETAWAQQVREKGKG